MPQHPEQRRAELQEALQYEVLRRMEAKPDVSQRDLASQLGISVGSINFCVRALIDKGFVKMHNFSQSQHKLGYIYLLTPAGIAQKSRLTAAFLKRKQADYEALQREIEELKKEVSSQPLLSRL
jgi:EPS-associated MarR family transcriptional regulator